jgi:hypothetical protein
MEDFALTGGLTTRLTRRIITRRCAAMLANLFLSVAVFAQTGPSTRPVTPTGDDISGMYSFLQEGEFVQITVEEQERVTGFISRFGDLPSDKGAFLDQFIKKGKLAGENIDWESEPVHGTWFGFRGTVARGEGKSPAELGNYVLKGTLTQYSTNSEKKTSARSREVIFKSFPKDSIPARSKQD